SVDETERTEVLLQSWDGDGERHVASCDGPDVLSRVLDSARVRPHQLGIGAGEREGPGRNRLLDLTVRPIATTGSQDPKGRPGLSDGEGGFARAPDRGLVRRGRGTGRNGQRESE